MIQIEAIATFVISFKAHVNILFLFKWSLLDSILNDYVGSLFRPSSPQTQIDGH